MQGEQWLGRFQQPVPIRCRGALHFYSARDAHADRLNVVVMAPRVPHEEARARLANLARVHRLAASAHVPDVAEDASDADPPWVALDCDGIADEENLTDFIRHTGEKLDMHRATTLGKTLLETFDHVHRIRDPETGDRVCLGSLAAGNVLFSARGKLWVVGFGAGPLGGGFIAPEVATGHRATPGADVYALTLFLRSQAESIRTPNVLRRVIAGHPLADAKLMVLYAWSNLQLLAGPVRSRPTAAMMLSQARKMWRILGFDEPDVKGFETWVTRAVSVEPERLEDVAAHDEDAPCIVVGRDAEWVETPNRMRHTLRARRPLRRLLLALATAHRERVGDPVSVDELLRVGWPGESPLPEAGSNRVYVAISTLRKMGLGDLLQRWDGGYRIDPDAHCHFEH